MPDSLQVILKQYEILLNNNFGFNLLFVGIATLAATGWGWLFVKREKSEGNNIYIFALFFSFLIALSYISVYIMMTSFDKVILELEVRLPASHPGPYLRYYSEEGLPSLLIYFLTGNFVPILSIIASWYATSQLKFKTNEKKRTILLKSIGYAAVLLIFLGIVYNIYFSCSLISKVLLLTGRK
jgi:hypothetical protein